MTIGTKIAAAFIKAQAEMGNAVKDNTNPHFKSKYADLNSVREACLPILNKHGIAVLQPIVRMGQESDNRFTEKSYVRTILLHESGETIESLTEIIFGRTNDAQAQGSGITYARRYGLQSLVCIGAEDDDGNKANEKDKNPAPKNALGITQNLVDGVDEDMKGVFNDKNQADYEKIKKAIVGCGSVEELETEKLKFKKEANSLKKYRPELYAEIAEISLKEEARILGVDIAELAALKKKKKEQMGE